MFTETRIRSLIAPEEASKFINSELTRINFWPAGRDDLGIVVDKDCLWLVQAGEDGYKKFSVLRLKKKESLYAVSLVDHVVLLGIEGSPKGGIQYKRVVLKELGI